VLDAYDFRDRKKLLDLGGGEGVFLRTVARRAPHLELALFDLPPVAARARVALSQAGLAERIGTHGGSFLTDELPKGYDVLSLIRVLHDHDDGPAQILLNRAYEALPPGGLLLIAEPMSQAPGAEPVGDAYFGFYLLAMGQGRPRSRDEISQMLAKAGFAPPRPLKTPRPGVAMALLARRA
jgi:demethylspheroidene O-methyltransferase